MHTISKLDGKINMVKIRQDLTLKENRHESKAPLNKNSKSSKETLQINVNISTSFRLKFQRGMNVGFRASFGSMI